MVVKLCRKRQSTWRGNESLSDNGVPWRRDSAFRGSPGRFLSGREPKAIQPIIWQRAAEPSMGAHASFNAAFRRNGRQPASQPGKARPCCPGAAGAPGLLGAARQLPRRRRSRRCRRRPPPATCTHRPNPPQPPTSPWPASSPTPATCWIRGTLWPALRAQQDEPLWGTKHTAPRNEFGGKGPTTHVAD